MIPQLALLGLLAQAPIESDHSFGVVVQAAAELGLFGSSLVVMLCGAGAFSLDRLLFGGTRAMRRARMHDDEDDH